MNEHNRDSHSHRVCIADCLLFILFLCELLPWNINSSLIGFACQQTIFGDCSFVGCSKFAYATRKTCARHNYNIWEPSNLLFHPFDRWVNQCDSELKLQGKPVTGYIPISYQSLILILTINLNATCRAKTIIYHSPSQLQFCYCFVCSRYFRLFFRLTLLLCGPVYECVCLVWTRALADAAREQNKTVVDAVCLIFRIGRGSVLLEHQNTNTNRISNAWDV